MQLTVGMSQWNDMYPIKKGAYRVVVVQLQQKPLGDKGAHNVVVRSRKLKACKAVPEWL